MPKRSAKRDAASEAVQRVLGKDVDLSHLSKQERELLERLGVENEAAMKELATKTDSVKLGTKLDLLFYLVIFLVLYASDLLVQIRLSG